MNDQITWAWQSIQRETPKWFADAKFGIFIHWGPYSVPAFKDEWYSRNMYCKGLPHNIHHEQTYGTLKDFGYKDFYPMMTGDKFDADAWADLIVRSGARYGGPVSEHCDNFSLWNSRINPINSVNYGPHRDVVGECFEALRKRGIRTLATFHHQWLWGWFMSTDNEADVYCPENEIYYGPALPLETNRYEPYRYPDEAFCTIWRKKVEEVVENYRPDIVYFDSRSFIIREEDRFRMAEHYYTHVNNGILTYKQEDFPKGLGVLDLERGSFSDPKPFVWQVDDRLEDNITWCMVQEPKYRPASAIIQQLCDTVAKNGNLLLNVGPYADGSFHPEAVKQLYAIGDWLKVNGEAIYETRPFRVSGEGPTQVKDSSYDPEKVKQQLATGQESSQAYSLLNALDFRFTTRDTFLYAISMGWPKNGFWKIRTLRKGMEIPLGITLLGSGAPLSFTQTEEALLIKAPQKKPCDHAFTLKITLAPVS